MARKVIFFGSPEFAIPSLEALLNSEFQPILVVTQTDKPSGRGRAPAATAVKSFAVKAGIPVETVSSFRASDIVSRLERLEPDFFVVVSFGLFLPESLLRIASLGNINLHASLLPAYRGASPINYALINGDSFTGVTTMEMVKEMDAGPVYLQRIVEVRPFENSQELSVRLSVIGAELVVETLTRRVVSGLEPVPQPEEHVSFARKLKKTDGLIPWEKDAISIHNHIRGMHPWPGSFTYINGKYIKVHKAEPVDLIKRDIEPGTVMKADEDEIIAACGTGAVRLSVLQAEGRKVLSASEFLRGFPIKSGDVLTKEGRR